jgi:fibronectin type 3 domain-containing protein
MKHTMNLNQHVRRGVLAVVLAGSIASAVGFAGAAQADGDVPQDPPIAATPTDTDAEEAPPGTVDGVEADDADPVDTVDQPSDPVDGGNDAAASSTTLPPATTEPSVAPPTTADEAETTQSTVAPATTADEPEATQPVPGKVTSTTQPASVIATTTPPADDGGQLSLLAATVASAPRSPVATAGNARVTLSWLAPASNGGAIVDQYLVQRYYSGVGWKNVALVTTRIYAATGLVNGTKYSFRIRAHNSAGFGAFSIAVGAVPRTVPSAPRSPVATPGNARVTLSWLAPASNGGAIVDKYLVQRYYTGVGWRNVALVTTRSYTATGLANGTKYSFRVRAHNPAGYGAFSTAVSAVPRTVPSAPRSPTATPGIASVTVSWQAPSSIGGATVGYYQVERLKAGTSQWASVGSPKGTSMVVSGTNGTKYSFRIRAHNLAGWSPWSTVVSATPGAPTAPLSPSAVALNGSVELHWWPPSSPGAATIGYYAVQQSATGTSGWTTITSPTTLGYIVPGLTNGTKYYFRILAHNNLGWSPASIVISATPRTTPSALQSPTATPGNGTVTLTWKAPTSNGGAPINHYRIQTQAQPNGPWTVATTSNLSYTAKGLTNGTNYLFRIDAHNAAGWSPSSDMFAAPRTVPSAPLALTATNKGGGNVQLKWNQPSITGGADINNYAVYQATSSAGPWKEIGQTGCNCGYTGYGASGLTNGTTYHFQVKAHNAAGWGPLSTPVKIVPFSWPSAPTCSAVQDGGAGSTILRINWSPPQDDGGAPIQSYRFEIWESSTKLYSYDIFANLPHTATQPLTLGHGYNVQIAAKNAAGISQWCTKYVYMQP